MKFSIALQHWYKSKNISLPWRGETDLYKIWLSEVMLQQTQVNTVIPYYKKWVERFPNLESVANANEDELLKFWEGLGYYSRARNFQFACKTVLDNFGGKIPEKSEDFLKLKGVGEYIHAAVHSIGLNKKHRRNFIKCIAEKYMVENNKQNFNWMNFKSYLTANILLLNITEDKLGPLFIAIKEVLKLFLILFFSYIFKFIKLIFKKFFR